MNTSSTLLLLIVGSMLSCQQPPEPTKPATTCGFGLVPIPLKQPIFCIMPFEAQLIDRDPPYSISQQGALPSTNVSFLKAIEACENTDVFDSSGEVHGKMRIATLQHWKDAGDGVIGDGGSAFPWGEQYDGRCIMDEEHRPPQYQTHLPSGSAPTCKSDAGVYDQIGNLWEWVDTGQVASKSLFLNKVNQRLSGSSIVGETIHVPRRLLSSLRLQTICASLTELDLMNGRLVVRLQERISTHCEHGGKGYLAYNLSHSPQAGDLLPVHLEPTSDPLQMNVNYDAAREGERIGAKAGGSFYSGAGNDLQAIWIGHIPTFNGSIGFRCEADPF